MSELIEPITNIVIDKRLESYASFYDHDWAQKFGKLSDKSTLRLSAFDLTRDWKGIAVATRMPWLMIESLQGFHEGFTKTNPPFYKRLTTAFGDHVLKDSKLSNMRRKEIMSKLNDLREKVEQDMELAAPPIDREKLWQEYLSVNEFGLALWNAQRIAYGAVYYAYENFVQRAVAAGKRDDDYRAMRFDQLSKDFAAFFGDELAKECLEAPEVNVARVIRNCLTHDGGRVSAKLKTKQHDISVVGGELHVMPEDVKKLFALLKDKATKIAEAAANLPAFAP